MTNSSKIQRGMFVLCIWFAAAFTSNAGAETLVMPRELVDFARANGCAPIDNFFERPGMVNPPFAYGWLPGNKENSAVFWCKKVEQSERPYRLMIKAEISAVAGNCRTSVEWWNSPGGLSIESRARLALKNFRYVSTPMSAGPDAVVANAKVLVSYYDGLTEVFYCYKGQWLVTSAE